MLATAFSMPQTRFYIPVFDGHTQVLIECNTKFVMYLIVGVTTFLAYFIYKWIKWFFSPYRCIPSPPEYPFFGHNPYFSKTKDTINLLNKWGEDFKEYGLFRLSLLASENGIVIVLLKPDYQKLVLSNPERFKRTKFFPKFFPAAGQGLLVAVGEHHRFQKKMLAKTFSMPQTRYYVPVYDRHTQVLIQIWKDLLKNSTNGENIDIKHYVNNLSFDIIGEIGFGYQFNTQKTVMNPIVKTFKAQTEGLLNYVPRFLLKYVPFLRYVPFGPARTIKDGVKASEDVLKLVIDKRKEKVSSGTLTEQEKNDLLSMMMTAKDEKTGQMFSEQLVKDNAYTFFIAGHETTATSLPGILYYLSKHQEYQQRCREEIQSVLVDETELDFDTLNQLPFTSAFIKESLRCYTPLPVNGRICTKDVTINGFHFPANTQFMLPVFISNKNEESFPDALKFWPERYLQENENKQGTSLSFGYGPYSCIGKSFALQEIKVIVVRLLQHFKFSIDLENENFIRRIQLTMKHYPSLKIRVQSL